MIKVNELKKYIEMYENNEISEREINIELRKKLRRNDPDGTTSISVPIDSAISKDMLYAQLNQITKVDVPDLGRSLTPVKRNKEPKTVLSVINGRKNI